MIPRDSRSFDYQYETGCVVGAVFFCRGAGERSRLEAVREFCYSTQHAGAYMHLLFFVCYQPVKAHTPQSRLYLYTLCKPPLTVAYPLPKLSLERLSHSSSFLFPIHRHYHVLLRREPGLRHEDQSSGALSQQQARQPGRLEPPYPCH